MSLDYYYNCHDHHFGDIFLSKENFIHLNCFFKFTMTESFTFQTIKKTLTEPSSENWSFYGPNNNDPIHQNEFSSDFSISGLLTFNSKHYRV
ncbi:hypothetical protein DERF_014197 [Dermatophagoides farinae]|uniref:Uncharacterized protein n=1 Tax=Dermatophagoides farinae TaxID=6954 RepID=A0A922KSJ2_DERFA|nr:hypothetical protein DERF_014197 [Dermatophagoides farinae]